MSARLSTHGSWRPSGPRSAVVLPIESLDASEHADIAAKERLAQQLTRDDSDASAGSSAEEEDLLIDESKFDDAELLKTKTPLLAGDDVEEKREEIRAYFHRTFSLYERLFDILATEETFSMQPEKLRCVSQPHFCNAADWRSSRTPLIPA